MNGKSTELLEHLPSFKPRGGNVTESLVSVFGRWVFSNEGEKAPDGRINVVTIYKSRGCKGVGRC